MCQRRTQCNGTSCGVPGAALPRAADQIRKPILSCCWHLCDASAGCILAGLVHVRGSLLPDAGSLNPADPKKASLDDDAIRHPQIASNLDLIISLFDSPARHRTPRHTLAPKLVSIFLKYLIKSFPNTRANDLKLSKST